MRRAKELIEQRDGQRVRVAELAAAANVSERTLRSAFKEYFGVGPNRYLQLRQLHQIHRALRKADPDAVSVSQVMIEHGEWEFGRLARRYGQLFGERPSKTLQAN
jgi:methylphosphotriester-DNA--protein-cysteine methyltransferase